jgi:hypothetical protein
MQGWSGVRSLKWKAGSWPELCLWIASALVNEQQENVDNHDEGGAGAENPSGHFLYSPGSKPFIFR